MIISGVSSEVTHTSEVKNDVLGKDDFLKLLIAQLSNQDPMEPLNNNEFIAQMTQFSSLEQLENISSGVESTNLLTQSMNNAFSTTLIGRNVVINSDTVYVNGGTSTACGFYAPSAGTGTVTVTDGNGNTVREIIVSADEAGYLDAGWDLRNNSGVEVSDGEYSISIEFTDSDGYQQALSPFITGLVSAVKFMGGNAYLTMEDHEYNLAQVVEVKESTVK